MQYLWKEKSLTLDYLPAGEACYRSAAVVTTGEVEHYDGHCQLDDCPVPMEVMDELRSRMMNSTDDPVRVAFESMHGLREYEIGGICVDMTKAQAESWNLGNITKESLAGAKCYIPGRVGGSSRVIDGEVVVEDGLPTVEAIDLWEAIDRDGEPTALYDEYMDGMPANRIS